MSFETYEKKREILMEFAKKHKVPITNFSRTGEMFESTTNPAGVHNVYHRKGGEIKREFRVTEELDAIIEDIYIIEDRVRHGGASIGCYSISHMGVYVFPLVDEETFQNLPNDLYEEMFINERGYAISSQPDRAYRTEHIDHGDDSITNLRREYELSLCGKFVVEQTYIEYVGPEDPNNNWEREGWRGYSNSPRVFKFPNNQGKIKEV